MLWRRSRSGSPQRKWAKPLRCRDRVAATKDFRHRLLAEDKDRVELLPDQHALHDRTQGAERQRVGHQVAHFHRPSIDWLEPMLVVPEPIRPDPPLIDDPPWCFDVRD